jgi:hypothetical protein
VEVEDEDEPGWYKLASNEFGWWWLISIFVFVWCGRVLLEGEGSYMQCISPRMEEEGSYL